MTKPPIRLPAPLAGLDEGVDGLPAERAVAEDLLGEDRRQGDQCAHRQLGDGGLDGIGQQHGLTAEEPPARLHLAEEPGRVVDGDGGGDRGLDRLGDGRLQDRLDIRTIASMGLPLASRLVRIGGPRASAGMDHDRAQEEGRGRVGRRVEPEGDRQRRAQRDDEEPRQRDSR